MPRLTEILMYKKPLKKFTNYQPSHVYRQMRPAVLKNSVGGKGDRKKVAPCLQEMSQMLVCLKDNDYNQAICSKEVQLFEKCYMEFQMDKQKNTTETDGKMMTAAGRVNSKQLNTLLQRYPQKNPE